MSSVSAHCQCVLHQGSLSMFSISSQSVLHQLFSVSTLCQHSPSVRFASRFFIHVFHQFSVSSPSVLLHQHSPSVSSDQCSRQLSPLVLSISVLHQYSLFLFSISFVRQCLSTFFIGVAFSIIVLSICVLTV